MRRTIIDGQPWFVAADVCRILGHTNPTVAYRSLIGEEKGLCNIETLGGKQKVNVVSRPGLFQLIQRSKKPQAKAFDHWVRHEVLPQVIDNGGYVTADADMAKVAAAAPANSKLIVAQFVHSEVWRLLLV